eukprot:12912512-Heterocapsa_arctica.AAC.1
MARRTTSSPYRIYWYIQRAPDRSGWRNSGKHIRTGSNLRRVWFHRARGLARNGSEDRRGIEEAKDNFRSHRMRKKDWLWDEYDNIW